MLRPFRVLQPQTIGQACAELRRYGDAASIYAGGSELLILLRHGLVDYEHLIDIKHIPALAELEWDGISLHIGANVTHRQLELSPVVLERMPVLAEVEGHVANVRVRNVGTIGGNLCFSDPHSDPGTVLLVHDAAVRLQRGRSRRRLPLEEFLVDSYETALESDELMVGVDVPAFAPGMGVAYERVEKIERPSVGVAAATEVSNGHVANLRLAVGCVGPKPVRLRQLEQRLAGETLADASAILADSDNAIRAALEPVDDIHGSADYKTYIVSVLLRRTLARAVEKAGDRTNG
jgi:aerobic carbon-monoxide dehydrogenase medium subunit